MSISEIKSEPIDTRNSRSPSPSQKPNFSCYICSTSRLADFSEFDPRSLIPEQTKNLQILCQLLQIHTKERMPRSTSTGFFPLPPFCTSCSQIVLELVDCYEKLVQLENQIVHKVNWIQEKVAAGTGSHDQLQSSFLKLESEDEETGGLRQLFRRQILSRFKIRQLIESKIKDYAIQPSLSQFNTGIRIRSFKSTQAKASSLDPCPSVPRPKSLSPSPIQIRKFQRKRSHGDSHLQVATPENPGAIMHENIEIIKRIVPDPVSGKTSSYTITCGKCGLTIDKPTARKLRKSALRLMKEHIDVKHLHTFKCHGCSKNLCNKKTLNKHITICPLVTATGVRDKRFDWEQEQIIKVPKSKLFQPTKSNPVPLLTVGDLKNGEIYYKKKHKIRKMPASVSVLGEPNYKDFDLKCGASGCLYSISNLKAKKQSKCVYTIMIAHIEGHHCGGFQCSKCKRTWVNQRNYQNHVKSWCGADTDSALESDPYQGSNPTPISTKIKKTICPICGKSILSSKKYLKNHMWTHKNKDEKQAAIEAGAKRPLSYGDIMKKRKERGDPKLQCSNCGKLFDFLCNLRRHEMKHHGKGKSHQCTICSKFYSTATTLSTHRKFIHFPERVHTKYTCTYAPCDKRFLTRSTWLKHEKKHQNERLPQPQAQQMHSCPNPNCGKKFSMKSSLQKHLKAANHNQKVDDHKNIVPEPGPTMTFESVSTSTPMAIDLCNYMTSGSISQPQSQPQHEFRTQNQYFVQIDPNANNNTTSTGASNGNSTVVLDWTKF